MPAAVFLNIKFINAHYTYIYINFIIIGIISYCHIYSFYIFPITVHSF